MKLKTLTAICLIALIFSNCKKAEKGDVGATGKDGINGNANIISSNTVLINSFVYYSSIKEYQASLTLSAINQDVLDKGAVMVYLSGGSNNWYPLPISDGSTVSYEIHLGGLTVFYFNNDNTTPSNPNGLYTVRVVVIPSQIIKTNPNIDLTNYAEVKQVLKLQD